MVEEAEKKLHEFMQAGTKALHHLYIVGQAIKNDKTFSDVDKEQELAGWEKDLIKLLIMIKPLFNMIIDHFPLLKSLIDWANEAWKQFADDGKLNGYVNA